MMSSSFLVNELPATSSKLISSSSLSRWRRLLTVWKLVSMPYVNQRWLGGLLGHRLLGLLLGADEQNRAAARDGVLDELVRAVDVGQGLLQVDDVDAVALGEDESLHLRVPAPGLVPEVDTALEQLSHGDDGHGSSWRGRAALMRADRVRGSVVGAGQVTDAPGVLWCRHRTGWWPVRTVVGTRGLRGSGGLRARDVTRRTGRTHMLPDSTAHPDVPRRAVRRAADGPRARRYSRPSQRPGCRRGPQDRRTPAPQPAWSAHGWAMRSLARSAASAAIGVALAATLATSLPQPSGQAGGALLATTSGPYRAPVEGAVLRLFDAPAERWSSGHRGVDLAAGVGEVVRSPAAGVVSFSGTVVDRGVVTITHPDGLRSSLEPVVGAPVAGTTVGAGDQVGNVQRSGHCAREACVHWGIRRGQTYLDPLELLGVDPVVLLPVP